MVKGLRGLMLVAASLAALNASAKPIEPKVLPHSAHGLFTGEEWRYNRDKLWTGFALRLAADLVSIPTGAPWWTPAQWAIFGGVVGSTVALSVGEPSVDVLFQHYVQYQLLGGADHWVVWGHTGDLIIWGGVAAGTLTLLLYGLISGESFSTETAILMTEAFIVAQLYHNMIKLLTGRAGPQRPEMYGHYYGPVGGAWLWPQGTPSGHMASMYSMLSVLMHMIDHPAAWVGLNAFALFFGASLVGDNYHWLSDVTFGAAIGFCVGRWVVRHRSTHYVYGVDPKPPPVTINVLPLLMPGSGAAGLGVVGTF